MQLSVTSLAALTRLFSSTVFRELATRGASPLFARLFRETELHGLVSLQENVATCFERAFSILRRAGSRDEYVYRAALTHNVLLGRHSLATASMLTEFRVGTCRADLAILNGTATAYEIKSERDSLQRLGRQLKSYQAVFPKVYVIASIDHVPEVLERTSIDIGVMRLGQRGSISTVRDAVERIDLLDSVRIFEALRQAEAKAILGDMAVSLPEVPNTILHATMRTLFAELDAEEVHRRMVTVLKQSRSLAPLRDLVTQLPRSLRPAALSIGIKRSDHARLVAATRMSLGAALTWT